MNNKPGSCPMSRSAVIDAYFLEHRAKLIDLAAFLDRVDRAEDGPQEDSRIIAFRRALARLLEDGPHRARQVLEIFSDPTTELLPASDMKGASGAYDGQVP